MSKQSLVSRKPLVAVAIGAGLIYAYSKRKSSGSDEAGGGGGSVVQSPVPANAAAGAIPTTAAQKETKKANKARAAAEEQLGEVNARVAAQIGNISRISDDFKVRVVEDSGGNFKTFTFIPKKSASKARRAIREGTDIGDTVTVTESGRGAVGVYDVANRVSREATTGFTSVDGGIGFASAPVQNKKDEKLYSEALFSPARGQA